MTERLLTFALVLLLLALFAKLTTSFRYKTLVKLTGRPLCAIAAKVPGVAAAFLPKELSHTHLPLGYLVQGNRCGEPRQGVRILHLVPLGVIKIGTLYNTG